MMMSYCKKSVHSFLGFANSKDNETVLNFSTQHHRNFTTTTTAATGGLALFTISNNIEKPPNVVECAAIKSPPPTLSSSSSTTPTHIAATDMMTTMTSTTTTTTRTATATDSLAKKDPGGIGFIDEVGGSVDGLMSCTESLGFESSDERRVDDHIENIDHEKGLVSRETSSCRSPWKRKHVKREVKKFPPPLSSLDHDGRPTIYLHPVRKDGRLELTGVKVDRRPEILQASRENGRLRLHLICDEEDEHIKEEEEEQMQEIQENCEVVEEKADQNDVKEKEEGRVERWKFPVASCGGGGDGFRRCNEVVSHHHHHHHHHRNLNVWRQHCLTIT